VRRSSWTAKLSRRANEAFGSNANAGNPTSPSQEEAAKAAILDGVMKGRQPTDLMLRCTYFVAPPSLFVRATNKEQMQAQFLTQQVRIACHHVHPSLYPRAAPFISARAGNVKTISGQFKKSDLCSEHRLNVCSKIFPIQSIVVCPLANSASYAAP
jgi:magnesium transporter